MCRFLLRHPANFFICRISSKIWRVRSELILVASASSRTFTFLVSQNHLTYFLTLSCVTAPEASKN